MVDFVDVKQAMNRLEDLVRHTSATPDAHLEEKFSSKISIKWENQQVTGSFKVRGALNTILSLPESRLERGMVASSSGNHGSGMCYAAKRVGVPMLVCVPDYSSEKKITTMRNLGAEVRVVDGPYQLAEEMAKQIAHERGATFVSPYNNPMVIAGQGTVLMEWLEQVPDLDTIILPVGGGGLASGIGLALKHLRPTSRLIGVQTQGSPFLYENWRGADMQAVEIQPNLADGITGRVDPNSITLSITRQLIDDFILVNDEEIANAVAYCYHVHGEIVESAGATGLAALLAGKIRKMGNSAGVLITGGNITPEKHQQIIEQAT